MFLKRKHSVLIESTLLYEEIKSNKKLKYMSFSIRFLEISLNFK